MQSEVTELLLRWRQGERAALEDLIPLVYPRLRRMAHRYMRGERAGHTLQTAALINEAYLQLVDSRRVDWHDRQHFFAIASQLMRRILVDRARSRRAQKRGGAEQIVPLDTSLNVEDERTADLVELDDALTELARVSPRKAKVIELRFFGGLSVTETAEVLAVSEATVLREWRIGRAQLMQMMTRAGNGK